MKHVVVTVDVNPIEDFVDVVAEFQEQPLMTFQYNFNTSTLSNFTTNSASMHAAVLSLPVVNELELLGMIIVEAARKAADQN